MQLYSSFSMISAPELVRLIRIFDPPLSLTIEVPEALFNSIVSILDMLLQRNHISNFIPVSFKHKIEHTYINL